MSEILDEITENRIAGDIYASSAGERVRDSLLLMFCIMQFDLMHTGVLYIPLSVRSVAVWYYHCSNK